MAGASTSPSPEDAERFRSFERQRHDDLATAYHDFFTPITGLAIKLCLMRCGSEPVSKFWMTSWSAAIRRLT